jgi:RNA polymerase sigma-70 factor (ECF subfamily)
LPEPLAAPNQESAELASSLTMAFLVLLEQLSPVERAVFLLREVFELDFDEIARDVGKSEANTRQILSRARSRLRDAQPRFNASRRESEEVVRRFRQACLTGNVEELMAVLQSDATLVADSGGKADAPAQTLPSAAAIIAFLVDVIGAERLRNANPQLATINGAPGLVVRSSATGDAAWSFDVVDGRIRAIYVMRNPDKLRRFLERLH